MQLPFRWLYKYIVEALALEQLVREDSKLRCCPLRIALSAVPLANVSWCALWTTVPMTTVGGDKATSYVYVQDGKCTALPPMVTRRYPDWKLIDEISIQLLEEGVGSFDVLQRSLPSVVLCRLETMDDDCTPERLLKIFRIAQLQIEYILKSQSELANKIEELQRQQKASEFENTKLRREMSIIPEKVDSLFKCDKCDKLFLRSCFLYDHIRRRHKEGEFSDSDNSVWK